MVANVTETLAFFAAFTGLGAFWVLWRETRRNNRVMLKLKRFSSHYTRDAAGDRHELEVWVVNRGIQMQNISMGLSFRGPGKSGNLYMPIPLSNLSGAAASTFLRGTTASFVLSTADKRASTFLTALRDFKEQRPVIDLYNSSFLACSFPVYSRWDWFRKLWNRLSFRLSFQRRVGEGLEGKGLFKMYQVPYFVIRSEQLRSFLKGVTQTPVRREVGGTEGRDTAPD